MRSLAHPSSGGTSAPVGQTVAQNIPSQAMHGCTIGSRMGVPAASPADGGAPTIASTGHASKQYPQRVQAARNAGSLTAPGGLKWRRGA